MLKYKNKMTLSYHNLPRYLQWQALIRLQAINIAGSNPDGVRGIFY